MKTSVVIGRFQTDILHRGHETLLRTANLECDELVILLGSANISFTDKNPLPFSIRHAYIKRYLPDARIFPLDDNPEDEKWSKSVDNLLDLHGFENITLYHARDGFGSHYSGKYKDNVKELKSDVARLSATKRRAYIKALHDYDQREFRRGIIYATENRFPIVYPTVDIAIMKTFITGHLVLLGRKKDRDKWVFPGGFVDPIDDSILSAASRELKEEVPGLDHHGLTQIGTYKINDYRYLGTKDSIMTTFFKCFKMSGSDEPGDDLNKTKWFLLESSDLSFLSSEHHILWKSLYKTIYK